MLLMRISPQIVILSFSASPITIRDFNNAICRILPSSSHEGASQSDVSCCWRYSLPPLSRDSRRNHESRFLPRDSAAHSGSGRQGEVPLRAASVNVLAAEQKRDRIGARDPRRD